MKPLPAAPLTDEDILCWLKVLARRRTLLTLAGLCEDSDRRDADLILHAQRHKVVAALQRTDDGSRIDLRLGAGISVAHLGLKLTRR
jgi:hypothetical protein